MSWLSLLVQNAKSHPPAINAARPSSILQRYPTPEMPFHKDCTKAALIIKLINLQAPFLALDFHSVEELVYLISNLPRKKLAIGFLTALSIRVGLWLIVITVRV
jgi:hypothetical protein